MWLLLLLTIPWGQGTIRFGKMVQVNDPDTLQTQQNHPAVVIDNNLNVYTAWQDDRDQDSQYEIYFSMSTDTGKTFSADVNLSNNIPVDDKYPQMIVLGNKLFVVWQGQGGGFSGWKVFYTYSDDGGHTFAPADTVPGLAVTNTTTSGVNDGPQPKITGIVQNDSVFLYLLWVDDRTGTLHVRLARSINEGNFTDMGIVDNNPGNVNRDPSIAVDSSGNVLIAYRYGTGGTNNDPHPWIAFNKSTDRGVTFNNFKLILDDSSQVYRGNPQITYASQDSAILITWEDCRRAGGNGTPDIFFTESNDGGATFDSLNLRLNWIQDTSLLYDNYRAQIAMSPEGKMAAVWHADPNTNPVKYSLYMCAYDDSIGKFGLSLPVVFDSVETYTGDSPGTFGNNFYPAGLKVADVNGRTNFFLVWKDLNYDPNGNIYFIRGEVVVSKVDIDVYKDSLDVYADSINFDSLPAGPAYVSKEFEIVNTSDSVNPDTTDGPSTALIDSIYMSPESLTNGTDTIKTLFLEEVPSTLSIGESAKIKLTLYIPEGKIKGDYAGYIKIGAVGADSTFDEDSIYVTVKGPYPEDNLDSLKIFPNPFRPDRGHTKVYFEGLTENAEVYIYDVKNRLVFHEKENNADGLITWDPRDAASGIYIYVVKNDRGEIRRGKIAVIK